MAWPIRPPCPSTGAPAASACWPTRRSSTASASAAAAQVIRKEKSQWMLAITKYAQRLHRRSGRRGLHRARQDPAAQLDRPLHRRRGHLHRPTSATRSPSTPPVPTPSSARPIWSSPRSIPLLEAVEGPASQNWDAVAAYQEEAARKSDFERGELNKEKTGVRLEGIEAINPVNGKPLPHVRLRLRPHGLRHRRRHGRPGPRPARLGVRQEVRPADHRGGRRAATSPRRPSSPRTTPPSWSTPASSTA